MALAALKMKEETVDERVVRLETNVEHIQSDISDIKIDMREMRKDIRRVDGKLDAAKIWALGLYAAMGVGMLTLIARAFKWI
jgi:predicted  nucleic acid-binding Zn-ribbon protein